MVVRACSHDVYGVCGRRCVGVGGSEWVSFRLLLCLRTTTVNSARKNRTIEKKIRTEIPFFPKQSRLLINQSVNKNVMIFRGAHSTEL